MSLIATTDFKNGTYTIPQNQETTVDLQMYIDRVEDEYLPLLFGKELYDLFVIDLAAVPIGAPTDPRFIFIFNPFTYQEDGVYLDSDGILDMLRGLVYYLYVRDSITKVVPNGIIATASENATKVSGTHHDINRRYNNALASYKAMQYYMEIVDPTLYPEFQGLAQRFNHIF